jgi:hypothetical protein
MDYCGARERALLAGTADGLTPQRYSAAIRIGVASGGGEMVAALAQSIFSALCIFFAGLALRNYFKLR